VETEGREKEGKRQRRRTKTEGKRKRGETKDQDTVGEKGGEKRGDI
jgi:hypothetical protein